MAYDSDKEIDGLDTVTPVTSDLVPIFDITGGNNPKQATLTQILALVIAVASVEKQVFTNGESQSITAASDTITADKTHHELSSDADYVMTSTPSIAAGLDGQFIIFHNTGNFTITLQDEGDLVSSGIILGGSSGLFAPLELVTLIYNTSAGAAGAWVVQSHPNTTSTAADVNLLVRNTSGSTIAKGKPVYVSGWNNGHGRFTIDLADANDSAKMPCIGLTTTSIGNNANGTVIEAGELLDVDTSASSAVGDGVWIGTTAGGLVYTRPTVDDIQRIATVARDHASKGVLLVSVTGRANDTPIDVVMNTLRVATSASPASNGAGTTGDITWDASYIYVCTATNTWGRAALTGSY